MPDSETLLYGELHEHCSAAPAFFVYGACRGGLLGVAAPQEDTVDSAAPQANLKVPQKYFLPRGPFDA